MNTVVFVLMMATGHSWVPVLEFNSAEKRAHIQAQIESLQATLQQLGR